MRVVTGMRFKGSTDGAEWTGTLYSNSKVFCVIFMDGTIIDSLDEAGVISWATTSHAQYAYPDDPDDRWNKIYHDQIEEALRLFRGVQRMHSTIFNFLLETRDHLRTGNSMSLGELVDLQFLLREVADRCDDIGKECRKVQQDAAKMTCILWTAKSLSGEISGDVVRGDLASGSPHVGQMANIPAKNTEEYKQLMVALKCPEDLIESGVLKVHWPALCDQLQALAAQGRPLPRGLDPSKTFDVYSVVCRAKKGVDDVLRPDRD